MYGILVIEKMFQYTLQRNNDDNLITLLLGSHEYFKANYMGANYWLFNRLIKFKG